MLSQFVFVLKIKIKSAFTLLFYMTEGITDLLLPPTSFG